MNARAHIVKCPDAADGEHAVFGCARSSDTGQCALSCLFGWRHHVDACSNCTEHIKKQKMCDDDHCARIRQFYVVCDQLKNLVDEYKLTLNGCVLAARMEEIRMLLRMDAVNIHYRYGLKEMTWLQQQTKFVFDVLAVLFAARSTYKQFMAKELDNIDLNFLLDQCFDYLCNQ